MIRHCTYDFTAAGLVYIRAEQDQASQHSSEEVGGTHETPPLAAKQWAVLIGLGVFFFFLKKGHEVGMRIW